jgi:hypothetical protein
LETLALDLEYTNSMFTLCVSGVYRIRGERKVFIRSPYFFSFPNHQCIWYRSLIERKETKPVAITEAF